MTTTPNVHPGQPSLFDRAMAAREQGRFEEAAQLYAQVPPDDSNYPMALHHLGVLKYQAGDLPGALQLMQQTLRLNPQNSRAEANQANILLALGRPDEALAACDRALAIDPQNAPAWNIKGCLLASADQHESAIECWSRAVEIEPDMAEAWVNRGLALRTLEQYDRAIESLESAAQLDPQNANVWVNYGLSLRANGRNTEALACFEKAVTLNPQDAMAWGNRGEIEHELGQDNLALTSMEQALRLVPQNASAWAYRGAIEHNLGRYDLALASQKHALQLDPQNADAWAYQGYTLYSKGLVEDALANFDKAVALGSSDHGAIIFARYCCQHMAQWSGLEQRWQRELELIRDTGTIWAPFPTLAHPYVSAGMFADGMRQLAASKFGHITPTPFLHRPASKRLRIAYLSADFKDHATAYLMAGVFEQHDRQRFDVSAVTFQPIPASPMGQRLVRAFGQVIDIHDKTDEQAVALMRELNIDIAIDLMGHTTHSRHGIFARRPAPIQINYLGYPGTSGATFIDYIIGDRWVTPIDQANTFSEKIVLMPDSYQANDDRRPIATDTPSRAALGLPESGFVFCCLNNTYKITPMVFDLWMQLLRDMPNSVLWLLADNDTATRNLKQAAQDAGVAPDRIIFAQRAKLPQHLARHAQADLFLDTWPYNAHTTASDALWAGLPVLTCAGETFASRVGASLLTACHLPELITDTPQDYLNRAKELAHDPQQLGAIRCKLQDTRLTVPLFDTVRFTRHLEKAYDMAWERFAQGLPPEHIIVPALPTGTKAGAGRGVT